MFMRIDTTTFDGENPFIQFNKCTELTVLLDENRFILTGKVGSISIVRFFSSEKTETENSNHPTAFTIPLSFTAAMFALDKRESNNKLSIETSDDVVELVYNGRTIRSNIYSANGLTIQQIKAITWEGERFPTAPILELFDKYGTMRGEVVSVSENILFMQDGSKTLLYKGAIDYKDKFNLSVSFVRAIKNFEADYIVVGGSTVVARTEKGLYLLDNRLQLLDDSPIATYRFATRIKTDNRFIVDLRKHLSLINIAANSANVSAELNLTDAMLIIRSIHGEQTIERLTNKEVSYQPDVDIFTMEIDSKVVINDAKLLKTLASFREVKVEVLPEFIKARLDGKFRLIFTVYESN